MRRALSSFLLFILLLVTLTPSLRTTYVCSGMGQSHLLSPCCPGDGAEVLHAQPVLRKGRCCAPDSTPTPPRDLGPRLQEEPPSRLIALLAVALLVPSGSARLQAAATAAGALHRQLRPTDRAPRPPLQQTTVLRI